MKLSRIAQELSLKPLTAGAGSEDLDVTAGYVSDLLSDVLASACLLYTSPSPRDGLLSRMPSSA